MFQFFITESDLTYDGAGTPCGVEITGADKNHMKNALRMHVGEEFLVCVEDTDGVTYRCRVAEFLPDVVRCEILAGVEECTELPCRITLYQGLAKGDKMETIIQKAVELGASRIVPVAMKHCVVKLDAKKATHKVTRYNAVALSAAKQSKRQRIPEVTDVCVFAEAAKRAKEETVCLVPYENARGMQATKEALAGIRPGDSVGIFIGPEGGFSEEEIAALKAQNAQVISLGSRILRTETAGMTALSVLMYTLETLT